ncbi:MAG: hypothetical protein NUV34_07555 [Sulfuricaulis sp.]|nr:hypothetical protein [Sulfuricaulis sp.]
MDWLIVLSSCRQIRQSTSGFDDFDEGFMHRQVIAIASAWFSINIPPISPLSAGMAPAIKSSIKAL